MIIRKFFMGFEGSVVFDFLVLVWEVGVARIIELGGGFRELAFFRSLFG